LIVITEIKPIIPTKDRSNNPVSIIDARPMAGTPTKKERMATLIRLSKFRNPGDTKIKKIINKKNTNRVK